MCIERGPIIHSRSQKSHCRLPFFLQRTRDPVSSSSSWSSSSSSSSFYPVTLDHANRSPTLFFFSPPRFFSNEFIQPFFSFLPKARATSASKHDDRPMMDRRIVDSPPPLSLVQEHSLNRVYRRRSSSSVIEHEIRRSIGRKLLSLKASLFLFFSWDGRRRWLPVHPIRGKITNGEPRGPPLSSILCPIYRNRASIPLLFLSSFFGRGLETLPPRRGGLDRGTIRGKVEREEVERDSGSRW